MFASEIRNQEIVKVDYAICCPGHPSSGIQAHNFIVTLQWLQSIGKTWAIARSMGSFVPEVRNRCLGKSYRKDQKPLGHLCDYERMIWVDSDNIVTPDKLEKLLAWDENIVSAWYRVYSYGPLCEDNRVSCGHWKAGDRGNGVKPFLFKDMAIMKGLVEVDYTGFGLIVIKKGVFESLEYPWFQSWVIEWEEEGVEMADVMTEDSGWCFRVKEKGFKIFVDSECQVLHERKVLV